MMTNKERVRKLTDLIDESVKKQDHWNAWKLLIPGFQFVYYGREHGHPTYDVRIKRNGDYMEISYDDSDSVNLDCEKQKITPKLIAIVDQMIDHVWERRQYRAEPDADQEYYSELTNKEDSDV